MDADGPVLKIVTRHRPAGESNLASTARAIAANPRSLDAVRQSLTSFPFLDLSPILRVASGLSSLKPDLDATLLRIGLLDVSAITRPLLLESSRLIPNMSALLKGLSGSVDLTATISGLQRAVRSWFEPGTLIGDWLCMRDTDINDKERMEALERLADRWFPNPLHPRRWSFAEPELRERAHRNGTTIHVELKLAVRQALPLAFAEAEKKADTIGDLYRCCKSELANCLMDDLAGPEWRRRSGRRETVLAEDIDEPRDNLDIEYEAEASSLREALRRIIDELPKGQRAAALAMIEGRPLTNAQHQALFRLRRSPERFLILQAAS